MSLMNAMVVLLCLGVARPFEIVDQSDLFADAPTPAFAEPGAEQTDILEGAEVIFLNERELELFSTSLLERETPAIFLPRNISHYDVNHYTKFQNFNVQDMYDAWEASVVIELVYQNSARRQKVFTCSGFFINTTHVLTAGHCVDQCVVKRAARWIGCERHPRIEYLKENKKFYLKSVAVSASPLFQFNSGFLVNLDSIVRPQTDLNISWGNQRDVAILTGPRLSSRVAVPLIADAEIAQKVGSSRGLRIVVIGFPPAFQPDQNVSLAAGTARGDIVNRFYKGGRRKLVTIDKGIVDTASHTWAYKNPTFGGFSGGLVAVVHETRLYGVGVHVGGTSVTNVGVGASVDFIVNNVNVDSTDSSFDNLKAEL